MNNPTHVKINNEIYEINTDFRTWIKFEQLWFDDCVTMDAKIAHAFKIIFPSDSPFTDINTLNILMYFYICGRRKNNKSKQNTDIVYDFSIDHQKIKASFMAKFGFNPWSLEYYHWWDFKACFDSLFGSDFENLIKIRTLDLSEFKGKHLKEMTEIKESNRLWSKKEIRQKKESEKFEAEFRQVYEKGNIAEYFNKIKC